MCNAISMSFRIDSNRGVPANVSVPTAVLNCPATKRAYTADVFSRKTNLWTKLFVRQEPPNVSALLPSAARSNCFMKSRSHCIPTATWSGVHHDPSFSSNSALRNSVNGSTLIGVSTLGFWDGASCNFVMVLSTACTVLVTFVSKVFSFDIFQASPRPDA